jgi:UDP-N-acetylglucosamine 2-epimerase
MKTIITVTGIRPDFIRMSEIFKKLDKNFNHILIHSGQHYNTLLSDVFFDELEIRKPDFNLGIGGPNKEHFHQTGELSIKLIELIREKKLNPNIILFLGDSNSVISSVALKKEGYIIGHIEAGMRSGDKRMLEEINRIVCDSCSDLLFVYHNNYKNKLAKENIKNGVYVVGNTIVEIVKNYIPTNKKIEKQIILDIHRPENFKYKNRLENIVNYANQMSVYYDIPVYMLGFPRTINMIDNFNINLGIIKIIELQPYKSYINSIYNSKFIISDSGTAQEEPALLETPVIVPRDFTERPESVLSNCSFMLDVNTADNKTWNDSKSWLLTDSKKRNVDWLGAGDTAEKIIQILKNYLK